MGISMDKVRITKISMGKDRWAPVWVRTDGHLYGQVQLGKDRWAPEWAVSDPLRSVWVRSIWARSVFARTVWASVWPRAPAWARSV